MDKKIRTTYDKQTLSDFKRFTLTKKSHLKPAILYLLCIGVIILAFVYNRKFELNFTTVIYPSIAIFCMIIVTAIYYFKPTGNNSTLLDKQVEYSFCEDKILGNGSEFSFEDFSKIYEDKYYYYFYLSDTEGFLIDKDDVDFDMGKYLKEKIQGKKVLHLLK